MVGLYENKAYSASPAGAGAGARLSLAIYILRGALSKDVNCLCEYCYLENKRGVSQNPDIAGTKHSQISKIENQNYL